MIQQIEEKTRIDFEENDLEPLVSEDSNPSLDALFKLQDFSSDSSNTKSEKEYFVIFECLSYSPLTSHARIHIMLDKYSVPYLVTTFFDTWATKNVANPKILLYPLQRS